VGVVQVARDQHIQDGVAKELQPLVAWHRGVGPAAVRQCLSQQRTVLEVVIQMLLDGHPAGCLRLACRQLWSIDAHVDRMLHQSTGLLTFRRNECDQGS
jgi:hypothetical protein